MARAPKLDKKTIAVIDDAHARAAAAYKAARDLADAALDLCTVWERARQSQGDQPTLDRASRRFVRAALDASEACNHYASKYVVKGPETMQTRWAKFTHWLKAKVRR